MNEQNSLPRKLIAGLDVPQLRLLVMFLNRTRRRTYPFSLNGETVITARKWARDVAAEELAARPVEPERMPRADPFGQYPTPPGNGRIGVTGVTGKAKGA